MRTKDPRAGRGTPIPQSGPRVPRGFSQGSSALGAKGHPRPGGGGQISAPLADRRGGPAQGNGAQRGVQGKSIGGLRKADCGNSEEGLKVGKGKDQDGTWKREE